MTNLKTTTAADLALLLSALEGRESALEETLPMSGGYDWPQVLPLWQIEEQDGTCQKTTCLSKRDYTRLSKQHKAVRLEMEAVERELSWRE